MAAPPSRTPPPDRSSDLLPGPNRVTDLAGLEALNGRLAGASTVALDTEFHAERRYRPQLYLVQVGIPGSGIWIIDPLLVPLEGLAEQLAGKELIVHSGRSDLLLLFGEGAPPPARVFDTQIAAAMLGETYPARLSQVAARFLHQTMDKSAALSDWSVRPLSPRQLAYAASDVAVLLELHPVLQQALEARGRLSWALEEGAQMAALATAPPPAGERWHTWRIAPEMQAAEQRCLTALFEWRDLKARERDQPPHYLLPDGIALDLARRRPTTPEQLAADRRVSPTLVRKHGAGLLAVISASATATSGVAAPPGPDHPQTIATLELWATLVGGEIGVAAELLLPRQVAAAVAGAGPDSLTGWRHVAIHDRLQDFFCGRSTIAMIDQKPTLQKH